MDFIDANEMLVVEQPWLSVVGGFPAALERKVYGT
jgi:U3 small nucleolar RNA-associated protein 4